MVIVVASLLLSCVIVAAGAFTLCPDLFYRAFWRKRFICRQCHKELAEREARWAEEEAQNNPLATPREELSTRRRGWKG